jgi:sulfotransferase
MPIHFLSGLPRSGSTLMAALLAQNPALHVAFQSPVGQLVTRVVSEMSTPVNEGGMFYTPEMRLRTLRSLFAAFYAENNHKKVIIDSSRRWCANMSLIEAMFPGAKTIACVRDVRMVLDSFERLFQKHPQEISRIVGRPNTTVYDRVSILLENDAVVGYSINAFRQAFYGAQQGNLLVVDYSDLANRPALVLQDLHTALQLKPFDYDFDNVETPPGAEEFDRHLGSPGLHTVRAKVSFEPRGTVLPPDIWASIPEPFWRQDAQKNSAVKSVR